MQEEKPRYRISFIADDQYAFDHFDTMCNYYRYGLKKHNTRMIMIPFEKNLLVIYREINNHIKT